MIRQNLHTHTCYDDGENTPMEMARAALDAGLTSLGFSGHSVLPYENDWSMTAEGETAYRAAVAETKTAFAGRLTVYAGLEWDILSPPPEGYDYVIGSIHHLPAGDGPPPTVDESPAATRRLLRRFGDDPSALAEAYFAQYAALAEKEFVDIVGHYDLLTKFDEREPIFAMAGARCRDAAMAGLEALLRADKLFEVNTGAIRRGWRTTPYPSRTILRELRARNARVLITSDAHSADGIDCAFPEAEALLRRLGFRERWELAAGGFAPAAL